MKDNVADSTNSLKVTYKTLKNICFTSCFDMSHCNKKCEFRLETKQI